MQSNNGGKVKLGMLLNSVSETHTFDTTKLIFLNTSDIQRGKILHRNYSEVDKMPGQAKKSVQSGDILFSEIRPANGRWAIMTGDTKDFVVSTKLMVLRTNLELALPEFMYIYLTSNDVTSKLQSIAEYRSATFPQITFDQVSELEIDLPTISEQKVIIRSIKSIDDKVEVNMSVSHTLEDVAQTIFKSWFIDFDPVKAKMAEVKPVGMDAATAALFPDSMEESAVGLIPSGWQVEHLGDLVTPKKGKTITKATCVDGEVPVVAGGLLPAYFHNTANALQPVITVSASGANAGYVRLYLKDIWASDCSYINSEITKTVHFWYLFLSRNQELIYGMQQGAAQPHIYPSDLMRLKLSFPNSIDLVMKFEETVTPLFLEIGELERQNESLRSLRDSLLPRLISGELQIPEDMLAS